MEFGESLLRHRFFRLDQNLVGTVFGRGDDGSATVARDGGTNEHEESDCSKERSEVARNRPPYKKNQLPRHVKPRRLSQTKQKKGSHFSEANRTFFVIAVLRTARRVVSYCWSIPISSQL